jgi:hypothetical protein
VAGPVGHIICALALLKSDSINFTDHHAFLAGTNFPDISNTVDVPRAVTHKVEKHSLDNVLSASSAFEAGRRFHIYVDNEREKHMLKHYAYRFVKNSPFKVRMLKLIEDHILFEKLANNFDEKNVFGKIYDEERQFSIQEKDIRIWHHLLSTYLDQSSWSNLSRYIKTLIEFKRVYKPRREFGLWQNFKTIGFLIYAYFQVEKISRNEELRAIILDFYENRIVEIIKDYKLNKDKKTVLRPNRGPPKKIPVDV